MECTHARPGERFDPGLTEGNCPTCGAIVGSETGQPTTIHQGPDGTTCSGSGQPAA
ncbi:hypothetical protein AB0N77_09935 [Streptomyces misionensis]|uniref:hypothetical protein n=1 Tax=Streptomyces misionensis TaxID=67331 RepID=UPI00342CDBB2